MSKFTDQNYLTQNQYRDSGNLDARIAIHKRFSTNPYGWFNWMFDSFAALPEHANILELGCGSGELWKSCADRIPAGWNITLTDLSDGMLDSAWRNLLPTGRSFKFEKVDAQDIPYADETFDAVMAHFMLYHVPDRPKSIREIRRVLKTGGTLFAATIGDGHMKEMMDALQRVHVGKASEAYKSPFTLQNGLEQLNSYFPDATVLRYEDNLKITEVEPVMAYIRSSIRAAGFSQDDFENVRKTFEQELTDKGIIFITKELGLFTASK